MSHDYSFDYDNIRKRFSLLFIPIRNSFVQLSFFNPDKFFLALNSFQQDRTYKDEEKLQSLKQSLSWLNNVIYHRSFGIRYEDLLSDEFVFSERLQTSFKMINLLETIPVYIVKKIKENLFKDFEWNGILLAGYKESDQLFEQYPNIFHQSLACV